MTQTYEAWVFLLNIQVKYPWVSWKYSCCGPAVPLSIMYICNTSSWFVEYFNLVHGFFVILSGLEWGGHSIVECDIQRYLALSKVYNWSGHCNLVSGLFVFKQMAKGYSSESTQSYPMNINMTGFILFTKIFGPNPSEESSLSIGRVCLQRTSRHHLSAGCAASLGLTSALPWGEADSLTLPMLRLLSFNTRGRKIYENLFNPVMLVFIG